MEDLKNLTFKESLLRSLAKSLTYRISSIIATGIISWVITKDTKEAISITIVMQAFLIVFYYSYERIWDKINWGRKVRLQKEQKLADRQSVVDQITQKEEKAEIRTS